MTKSALYLGSLLLVILISGCAQPQARQQGGADLGGAYHGGGGYGSGEYQGYPNYPEHQVNR